MPKGGTWRERQGSGYLYMNKLVSPTMKRAIKKDKRDKAMPLDWPMLSPHKVKPGTFEYEVLNGIRSPVPGLKKGGRKLLKPPGRSRRSTTRKK